jgi:hypothetical protein
MELGKYYTGGFLKIGENVKHGDYIRFDNEGENQGDEAEPKIVFNVTVIRDNEEVCEAKFQMNKTNFRATSSLYGSESSEWVGKMMEVTKIKARNPKTGMSVDSIELVAPGKEGR